MLARVPAGDQTVTGRAPGYSTGSADVTVLKDKTVSAGYVRLVPLTTRRRTRIGYRRGAADHPAVAAAVAAIRTSARVYLDRGAGD